MSTIAAPSNAMSATIHSAVAWKRTARRDSALTTRALVAKAPAPPGSDWMALNTAAALCTPSSDRTCMIVCTTPTLGWADKNAFE